MSHDQVDSPWPWQCEDQKKRKFKMKSSPQHKHWPTGPAHFSDRRASTGQYIVSFTGPAGPPS